MIIWNVKYSWWQSWIFSLITPVFSVTSWTSIRNHSDMQIFYFVYFFITLYTIQIVSKQLYSVKQEKSLPVMQEDNNEESFFQLKSIHWWFRDVLIQFSSLLLVSVQSVKRPQISKSKATVTRNQNSIGDRNEKKKTLAETRLSSAVINYSWCSVILKNSVCVLIFL